MDGILVTDEIESEVRIDTEIILNENEEESEIANQLDDSGMTLEDMIKTVGMKTFVEYYNKFFAETSKDIIDYMKLHENYKNSSIRTKACTGKRIIKCNKGKQALEIISKSDRVDNLTREKAKKLLNDN